MDLIIRNARLAGRPSNEVSDIGIERGRIVALQRGLKADAESYDAKGRLACPGLIETHIHLDKSRIIDRCAPQERSKLSPVIDARTPEQAVAEISQPVAAFKNGKRTVEWNPPELLRPR